MKNYKSFMLTGILIVGLLAGCTTKQESAKATQTSGGAAVEKKVLIMGTSADFAPFEYVETAKSSDVIGFDVDLAKLLGEKVGYEVKVMDTDFNGLITAMQAGKIDFVMSGLEATPDRAKNADFTIPYYRDDMVLLIKKDSGIKTLEDLKGKTVGVQVGSVNLTKAEELKKTVDFKIVTRDHIPDVIQEIKSNRVQATVIENVVAKGYLDADAELMTTQIPNSETKGASIGFPKGSALTEKFNKAIQDLKDSGELNELIKKWFG
jgi:ABC-type amino acid transport substrate-binding protein